MKKIHYLPTVDEDNRPVVIKVKVIGDRGQWRLLHIMGEKFKNESEVVVHERHLTQDWLAAWIKAKSISGFRRSCRNGHTSARVKRSYDRRDLSEDWSCQPKRRCDTKEKALRTQHECSERMGVETV